MRPLTSRPARTSPIPVGFGVALAAMAMAVSAVGQSYRDLSFVRSRPAELASVLKARVGVAGNRANSDDGEVGRDDNVALDGYLYYRNDRFSSREAILDAYAGRDGAVISLKEERPGEGVHRVELTSRYFQFYREGFYRGSRFIPTGRYESRDFGVYLGTGSAPAEGLSFEVGGFYRRYTFDENDATDPNFTIPDDFNGFGGRAYLEHNTLDLDRSTGKPYHGFILTVMGEREQNDSQRRFGTPTWQSDLPSGFWRARGHLEWYMPEGDLGVWNMRVDGSWTDDQDRIYNYDAWTPGGFLWIEGEVGFRLDLGGLSVTPFGLFQYVKSAEENGFSKNEETYLGGGARVDWRLSDSISVYGEYSFLDNANRPPTSASEDTFGEHQFFGGVELMFGGQRL